MRSEVIGQITAPKIGHREEDRENHNLAKQEVKIRNFHGNQCQGRKPKLMDGVREAPCGQV